MQSRVLGCTCFSNIGLSTYLAEDLICDMHTSSLLFLFNSIPSVSFVLGVFAVTKFCFNINTIHLPLNCSRVITIPTLYDNFV